jgi:hypothetical protein
MPAKAKLSAKAKRAVVKLQAVEDKLLTAQATIPGMIREVQEVKAMFAGTDEKEASNVDPAE